MGFHNFGLASSLFFFMRVYQTDARLRIIFIAYQWRYRRVESCIYIYIYIYAWWYGGACNIYSSLLRRDYSKQRKLYKAIFHTSHFFAPVLCHLYTQLHGRRLNHLTTHAQRTNRKSATLRHWHRCNKLISSGFLCLKTKINRMHASTSRLY